MTNTILKKPVTTEKTVRAAGDNVYTFEVLPSATKPQIKAAAESLFGVKVRKITTATKQTKPKRTGKRRLLKPGRPQKQARLWLQKGDRLDLFETAKEKK